MPVHRMKIFQEWVLKECAHRGQIFFQSELTPVERKGKMKTKVSFLKSAGASPERDHSVIKKTLLPSYSGVSYGGKHIYISFWYKIFGPYTFRTPATMSVCHLNREAMKKQSPKVKHKLIAPFSKPSET